MTDVPFYSAVADLEGAEHPSPRSAPWPTQSRYSWEVKTVVYYGDAITT